MENTFGKIKKDTCRNKTNNTICRWHSANNIESANNDERESETEEKKHERIKYY